MLEVCLLSTKSFPQFNFEPDDCVPVSFRAFAELRFLRMTGSVDEGEVDSDMEESPLFSTFDSEPHKQLKTSGAIEQQSWLPEDDILESDE